MAACLQRFSKTRSASFLLVPRRDVPSCRFSQLIIQPKELAEALSLARRNDHTASRIIPVCAAWFLPNDAQKRTGRTVFEQERIPGARFFDIDVVADQKSQYPHMLPSAETFSKTMRELGIQRSDTVVVYDTKELGIFSAPRALWTFKIFGHPRVHMLDNFRLWTQQGYDTETGALTPSVYHSSDAQYPDLHLDTTSVAAFEEVKEIVEHVAGSRSSDIQILDARSPGRFSGTEPEPRPGLLSGHIPNSLNIPFQRLLDPSTGSLLSKDELTSVLTSAGIALDKSTVTTCGTGVTAAIVDLALVQAGLSQPKTHKIYDGSWTEWAQRVPKTSTFIETSL